MNARNPSKLGEDSLFSHAGGIGSAISDAQVGAINVQPESAAAINIASLSVSRVWERYCCTWKWGLDIVLLAFTSSTAPLMAVVSSFVSLLSALYDFLIIVLERRIRSADDCIDDGGAILFYAPVTCGLLATNARLGEVVSMICECRRCLRRFLPVE